ncbi:hypothetical protein NXX07_14810 [Bacteroides fragilis]|nr:hypothetical protein NXX07_14810 [Bacteroides fragilis]
MGRFHVLTGKGEEASRILERAARLRLRFACDEQEIPQELLNRKPVVIYTCDRSDMGVPDTDRKELEAFIDSIPEVPSVVRERVKEDARIKKFDLKKKDVGRCGRVRRAGCTITPPMMWRFVTPISSRSSPTG